MKFFFDECVQGLKANPLASCAVDRLSSPELHSQFLLLYSCVLFPNGARACLDL